MAEEKLLDLPAGAGAPDFTRGSVFFVGTATVVLRYAGFTILTDPNFLHAGDHVHLGYGLTSKRLTNPAMELDDLPLIDFLVLSHLHEDHFDRVVAKKLSTSLPIVTTPHAADKLAHAGFGAAEALTTWQTLGCRKADTRLRITAMPGRHGPRLISALLPPVMGSMLEFETSAGDRLLRLYITGDTLVHAQLADIRTRYDDIDIALLHLGGTRVLGLLVTMDARQGVELMRIVEPHRAIPIHYNDYTVFTSPLADFQREAERAGLGPRLHYLAHGESYGFDVPQRGVARPA